MDKLKTTVVVDLRLDPEFEQLLDAVKESIEETKRENDTLRSAITSYLDGYLSEYELRELCE